MPRAPVSDYSRYWFDALIARGAWVLVLALIGAALVMVALVSILAVVTGVMPSDQPFGELLWIVLMHAIDPGTITGDEGSVGFRAVMMTATAAGILMIGGVVGVIVAGVGSLFDNLRKGRSRVLERNHTLIIGWSRQVFTIIDGLVLANASRRGGCVVILADRDKVEMEEMLRAKIPNTGKTRVIVRSGDATDPGALTVVSPETARAIIVLAPEDASDDTQSIRALLAVGRHPPADIQRQHVVAEIRDPGNAAVAKLTGKVRLETLAVGELVAQLSVQTCLQSGLSVVYDELLGFDGDEIYFFADPGLAGLKFGDLIHRFSDATAMGLRRADGQIVLNPAMDALIEAGDSAIVIASDDDRISFLRESPNIDETSISNDPPAAPQPKRTLVLGWGTRGLSIVAGIDAYVCEGSVIEVVSDDPDAERSLNDLKSSLRKAKLIFTRGDITSRVLLDRLALEPFDHVLLLADERVEEAHEADARSLVTLLHLRDLASRTGRQFSTVSEMRDIRSRDLAEVARPDDFIISDRLLGLLLTQIAENADLAAVFRDLFDPEGAEIYLRPASEYVRSDRDVDFHTVIESARRKGQTALGIRLAPLSADAARDFGVILNPDRRRRFRLQAQDRIIVLASE